MCTSSSERSLESETLWSRWARWGRERGDAEAVIHWTAGEEPFRWSWRALVDSALGFAGHLRLSGVKPGDVCALIVRHHRDFYPLYMGVAALGAIPSVLAYPNARLHPDKFLQGMAGMARRSGLDWILTEKELEPRIAPLVGGPGSSVRGLVFPLERSRAGAAPYVENPPERTDPKSPCLLQHSSGTTGLQKAVVLSHDAVLRHVDAYSRSIGLRADDKIASWLPLYHDMGMIAAFQLPLAQGIPVVQLDPFEWVTAPVLLLEAIAQERATISWLPNFAYNLLADRVRDDELGGVCLDSLRLLVNCSEPVRHESHLRFGERFGRVGLRATALGASYAMAETTFAATQTRPGQGARCLVVDRDALVSGVVSPPRDAGSVRACVSSGAPIPGCALRIVDERGRDLLPGRVGEIAIRSETMFDGYRNAPDETERVMRDGWYFSGDVGFLHEGECYVVGRKKDLIIVAGKNLYPEDIEDAVGRVPGVVPGRVVAFGVEDEEMGTERIGVVAESDVSESTERAALVLAIRTAGMAIDVTISDVHLAPHRWLIKSSSGKPSRKANRDRVLAGELERLQERP